MSCLNLCLLLVFIGIFFGGGSHNLALLLLKTSDPAPTPTAAVARLKRDHSMEEHWQWDKNKQPPLPPGFQKSASVGGGGTGGRVNGMPNGGIDQQPHRWRHLEAVRLLERALAVHREVGVRRY